MVGKVDKVIVTNSGALNDKYGPGGLSKIKDAINKLIEADRKRGLQTQFIALDDKISMKGISTVVVTRPADAKQNKTAIDAVYNALAPDYLMLLGAVDVIPHQDLNNPLFKGPGGDDPDKIAYGDVPYACEAPYSRAPEDFKGPTRVVGRLPDITGGSDPSYVIGLLNTASTWTDVDRSAIGDYFAVSAQIWDASTTLSTTNIFGNASDLQDVPPTSSNWPGAVIGRRVHFFNCHGASLSHQFYGQPASGAAQYPVALDAAQVTGKVAEGTIAAAECCYGGQLYALSATRKQIGMCNTYLAGKSYGFFASTTIAYGPDKGNAQADLICQYFLEAVLEGASLGRAALEARQKFVKAASPTDPSDTKTLAQFNLYGDPSITPIKSAKSLLRVASLTSRSGDGPMGERAERHDRRRFLFKRGLALAASEPVLRRRQAGPPKSILNALRAQARQLGFEPGNAISYAVRHPPSTKSMPRAMRSDKSLPIAYHVLFVKRGNDRQRTEQDAAIHDITLLIGKETGVGLVSVVKAHSR